MREMASVLRTRICAPCRQPLLQLCAHMSAGGEYRDCAKGKFVGSAVDLAGSGRKQDWIAKTADGCAWGVANAKIWVLKHDRTRYRVVLYYGGQAVVFLNAKTHGLHDLTMPSGTAGHYSDTLFKFDGVRYSVFRSFAIDLGNPEEIKQHPNYRCDVI